MNLYLPIWLYRVRYEAASGRAYSEIDKFVLRALAAQPIDLQGLCDIFALRRVLIIEVLVTLGRAGWVAMNLESGAFYATEPGKRALDTGELPPFIQLNPRTETIIVERLEGGITVQSRRDVQYQNRFTIERDTQFRSEAVFSPRFLARRLDAGQVDALLPCEGGEWLRWVDEPLWVSEAHWVIINVNPDSGEISGIPDRWKRRLRGELLDRADQVWGKQIPRYDTPERMVAVTANARVHSVDLTEDDVIVEPETHSALLCESLATAQSFVYVASAFFNPAALATPTRDAILKALKRGVRVGFLWGYEEGARARAAVQWMAAIRKEALQDGRNLDWNEIPSGSHAKFLLHDAGNSPTLYLGSYNWLSSSLATVSTAPLNITLRVSHSALLAELVRTFAALWSNVPQHHWSAAAAHLHQIAAELAMKSVMEPQAAAAAGFARVRLIRDLEHEAVMRDLLNAAQTRCWIASHKLGKKAAIRLAPLLSSKQSDHSPIVLITYDQNILEPGQFSPLEQQVRSSGARLEHRTPMHAKCLVIDDCAVISSFNFLSADPFNTATNAREVGVLVEGASVAAKLWLQLAQPYISVTQQPPHEKPRRV